MLREADDDPRWRQSAFGYGCNAAERMDPPPRSLARPTTRSPAAFRRARARQGQAFGGAEEAPSLTAAARDGDGNMRSGRKNARGSGRTKKWNAKDDAKWRDAPLTKKAPYKPDAGNLPVRFDERCALQAR